jgi:hypothetical protein
MTDFQAFVGTLIWACAATIAIPIAWFVGAKWGIEKMATAAKEVVSDATR